MTFRLCLVGNSHIGAYKRALTAFGGDLGDVAVTMFGAPGSMFADLRVENGAIVTDEEDTAQSLERTGGSRHIRLADYDAIVVIGASARLGVIASLLRSYRPPFLHHRLDAADRAEADRKFKRQIKDFYAGSLPVLVSDGLFGEILKSAVAQGNANQLLDDLAREGGVSLGHVVTPFPSSLFLEARAKHPLSRICQLGMGPFFSERYWRAVERSLPASARLIRPPDDVIVDGLTTERSYSDGSIALSDEDGEHGEEDFLHMNESYGRIMLPRVVTAMRR
jgi:hypothetical protein